MKNFTFKYFFTLILFFIGIGSYGQNAIAGSGFTFGWPSSCNANTNFSYFNSSAGSTMISNTLTPNGSGNQFWRLATDYSGTIKQMNNGSSSDVFVNPGTKYSLNTSCTSTGAFERNVSSTNNRYIFKTLNSGTSPTGTWVYFELVGSGSAAVVQSVSTVTQSPVSASVVDGNAVTVSANLSGAFNSGQSAYLRYSNDNFATSSVVEMTASTSTLYIASIPSSVNTVGKTVNYYVFTSGNGLTIPPSDVDLYTINLNNNGGSNYSYSVKGIYGAKIGVNFNSGSSIWRYTGAQDSCDNGSGAWSGTSLGTLYTNNSIVLVGANLVATTGSTSPQLFYRIYKVGDVAPSFTSANLTTTSTTCGSNTKYESAGLNITISSALYAVADTYNFEVYHQATNVSALNMGASGSPYVATFNVLALTTPTGLTTTAVSAITPNTATSGGNITGDGGATITERGIVYSTSSGPTISNSKVIVSGTTGAFVANLSSLTPLTTYYVRSYATNSIGTSYGAEVSFTTSNPFLSGKSFFKLNGATTQYYGCNLNTSCDPGQTSDLSSTVPNVGSLIQGQNFQIGGNSIQWGTVFTNATMYYRVYKSGNTAPAYSSKVLANIGAPGCNATYTKWENNETTTTIVAGINSAGTNEGDGTYLIEVYYTANSGAYTWYKTGTTPFSAYFNVITPTPVGERDVNDGNYDPTATNSSGMYESYMGILVEDQNGAAISGLNRVFNMDGALSSTNLSNYDFGTQNPGLTFNVGTETKIFTKGTHKDCGCSSWYYVYKNTDPDPVASDFPLPTSGVLFSSQLNGKFTMLNSSESFGSNQVFTRTTSAGAFGTTSDTSYNSIISAATTIKYKDYTDPTTGVVSTINTPVNSILCPTCSGTYKVAIAMLAKVSTTGNCNDATSLIYHRDINKNKVTDAGIVLNPNNPDAPTSGVGNSYKNTLPGTDLFYVSKVTIGAQNGTKTWNGSWSSGLPTEKNDVVMSADYSTASGSFKCNNMTVNTGVTVTIRENEYIEALNTVTTSGTGKIVLENTGNFVQRCDEKPAAAYIEHKKTTMTKRKWDYEYWGTPITQDLFSTIPSPFDRGYYWQGGAGGGWKTLTSTTVGKGFILRVGNVSPYNIGSGAVANWQINGTANNGIVTVPIVKEDASLTNYNNDNLLANPYASALDGESFVSDPNNTNIYGSLYFWTSQTQYPGTGQYLEADYAIWNLSGSVTRNGVTPNGKIPSGQGFFVKVINNGSVLFKDYMRTTTLNTQFYRTSNLNSNVNRYWINLTDGNGVDNQILIAYINQATNGIDRLYDAPRNSESSTQLYMQIADDFFEINGKAPFTISDEVPIGIKKANTTAQTLTLTLTKKEGIFADNSIPIYLYDSLLDEYHNLQIAPYTYTTTTLEDNNRFRLVYQNNSLGSDEFKKSNAIAFIKNQTLNIQSNDNISKVVVYDVSGRKIAAFNNQIPNKSFSSEFNFSNGIYIAKIILENGKTISQKITN